MNRGEVGDPAEVLTVFLCSRTYPIRPRWSQSDSVSANAVWLRQCVETGLLVLRCSRPLGRLELSGYAGREVYTARYALYVT